MRQSVLIVCIPANVIFLQPVVFVVMGSKHLATYSPNPEPSGKGKWTSLTLEMKQKILKRTDAGEGASALECAYNLNEYTIYNIKGNAEKIQSALVHSTPMFAKVTTRVRNPPMGKMEKILWFT